MGRARKSLQTPAGRLRLLTLDGQERLLDDELTECLPAWSPDSAKVITAFDVDVGVFDAATDRPTQARIRLRDALLAASFAYEKTITKKDNDKSERFAVQRRTPSFNPIIRVEWTSPEIYLQTAYIRVYPNESINTFQRWHRMTLSPQAAVLK